MPSSQWNPEEAAQLIEDRGCHGLPCHLKPRGLFSDEPADAVLAFRPGMDHEAVKLSSWAQVERWLAKHAKR